MIFGAKIQIKINFLRETSCFVRFRLMSFNDGFRKSYKRTNDCNVDNSTRNWQKREFIRESWRKNLRMQEAILNELRWSQRIDCNISNSQCIKIVQKVRFSLQNSKLESVTSSSFLARKFNQYTFCQNISIFAPKIKNINKL